jgi:hypothetical protein
MSKKNPHKKIKINTFINTNPKKGADHMISILDNCLKGLQFNPRKPERKMQQHIDLLSPYFINDFQWRQKRNKGRELVVKNNAGPSIVLAFWRQ